jgi:hypothetical protein
VPTATMYGMCSHSCWFEITSIFPCCQQNDSLLHAAKMGLSYPDDNDPRVRHLPIGERRLTPDETERLVVSGLSCFSFVTLSGSHEEEQPEDQLTVFVDWEERTAYLFDREPIRFPVSGKRRFLKYVARS